MQGDRWRRQSADAPRRRDDRRVPRARGRALRVRHVRARRPRAARRAASTAGRDPHHLRAPRVRRRLHGRRLLPRAARARGDGHLLRAGIGQPARRARLGADGLLGAAGDHRQRPHRPVQPRPVPGDGPPPAGRLPQRRAPVRQALLPGHAGRAAAADAAPGVRDDAHRAARARCTSTCRSTSSSRRPTSRSPTRARGAAACQPGSRRATDDVERCLDLLLGAERPVIVAGHGVELGGRERRARALRRGGRASRSRTRR